MLAKPKISFHKRVHVHVHSKEFDYFIIFLVIIYTLLVFIYFALDNEENRKIEDITFTLNIVQIIEMVILIIFATEILLRIYSDGFKVKPQRKEITSLF